MVEINIFQFFVSLILSLLCRSKLIGLLSLTVEKEMGIFPKSFITLWRHFILLKSKIRTYFKKQNKNPLFLNNLLTQKQKVKREKHRQCTASYIFDLTNRNVIYNSLTPSVHEKVLHIWINLKLLAASFFKYGWPFSGHQELKGCLVWIIEMTVQEIVCCGISFKTEGTKWI